ncbi:MAG: DNA adenine methylase [Aquabacterium sp.]
MSVVPLIRKPIRGANAPTEPTASTPRPRPVMRYHGGKFRLAQWIIGHFPSHDTYVEPFAGAASVLMAKPKCRAEVYNDLDSRVVNVFRVLRNQATANELRRRIRLTPFSREEFEDSYAPATDPVDAAHKTIMQSFMGYGSDATTREDRPGFRAKRAQGTLPSSEWAGWPESVPVFTERLRSVVIESRDALELMPDYDTPTSLFYVDPPYVRATRYDNGRHGYRHELSDQQHEQLAAVLHGLKGMVVLSGYACELYDQILFKDWIRFERDTVADSGGARTEVVWLNPSCAHALHKQQTTQASLLDGESPVLEKRNVSL